MILRPNQSTLQGTPSSVYVRPPNRTVLTTSQAAPDKGANLYMGDVIVRPFGGTPQGTPNPSYVQPVTGTPTNYVEPSPVLGKVKFGDPNQNTTPENAGTPQSMPISTSVASQFTPQETVLLWLQNSTSERAQALRNATNLAARATGGNYFGLLIEQARVYALSPGALEEATAWLRANPTFATRSGLNAPAVQVSPGITIAGLELSPRLILGAVVVLVLIFIFK